MTVKEYKKEYEGQYVDVETYIDLFKPRFGFHSDRIKAVDVSDEIEVVEAQLMDKEDYSSSVLANVSVKWEDFGYSDNDKILVLKVKIEA